MYITLEQAKKQIIVDDSFSMDDEQILHYIKTAEMIVSKSLCRPLESFLTDEGLLEDDIAYTILLMVTHLYNNRDPVTFGKGEEMPLGYNFMVSLNKDYSK